MCLWTEKFPLNCGSHPVPDSRRLGGGLLSVGTFVNYFDTVGI